MILSAKLKMIKLEKLFHFQSLGEDFKKDYRETNMSLNNLRLAKSASQRCSQYATKWLS